MIFVSNLACCIIWRWWFANVFDIGFFVGGSCGFEIMFEQQSENWWSFSITHCAFPNGEINGIPVINSLELWAHIQWNLSFQSAKKGDIPVILTELSPRFPKVMPSHSFNQLTFAFTLINLHSRRNRFLSCTRSPFEKVSCMKQHWASALSYVNLSELGGITVSTAGKQPQWSNWKFWS